MFFMDSEKRAGHKFVDRSLETTEQVLKHRATPYFMGRAAVENVALLMNQLYVPNIKDGLITLPSRKVDSNNIPIVAARQGQSYQLDSNFIYFTDAQELSAYDYFENRVGSREYAQASVNNIVRYVVEHSVNKPTSPVDKHGVRAMVTGSYYRMTWKKEMSDTPKPYYYQGRPVVVLGQFDDAPRVSPEVTIHELEHVAQRINEPIYSFKDSGDLEKRRFRNELYAYDTQLDIEHALAAMNYEPLEGEELFFEKVRDGVVSSFPGHLASLREETNKDRKDKFYPNGTLIKSLRDSGIDIA